MSNTPDPRGSPAVAFPETADVETSSEDYARRFAGPVGDWFLELQTRTTLELLGVVSPPARVLDVGGGHGQLTPDLVRSGYEVVVVGSAPSCGERIAAWLDTGRCRFDVGSLLDLPYANQSFDAVLSFRLLPHVSAWPRLISELCRLARRLVIVDYPSLRSVNRVADALFSVKKRIEGNTRPFTLFRPSEIRREFERHGFAVTASRPQFLCPMVLHRLLSSPRLSRRLEAPGRLLGLTRWLGSPVIVRAERVSQRSVDCTAAPR